MSIIHQWKGCHTGNSMVSMLILKFIFGGNGNYFKITYFEKIDQVLVKFNLNKE